MSDPEPWGFIEDAPRHLGISKDTVYRWIEIRNPLAHRSGRLWKFKLSDIDEWAGGAGDAPIGERA